MSVLQANLIEPLRFSIPADAQRFAHRHVCGLCRAALVADGTGVNCPNCGPAYAHSAVSRSKMEQVESDEHATLVDLGAEKYAGKSTETILTELGF